MSDPGRRRDGQEPGRRASRVVPVLLAVTVVVGIAAGVRWAVDNTLTRHDGSAPGTSMVVTIRAERQSAAEHGEDELVEALVAMCQLEVGGLADPDSLHPVDGGQYEVVVEPALDSADRRQLEGCLEDLRIDHFRATVVGMEQLDG